MMRCRTNSPSFNQKGQGGIALESDRLRELQSLLEREGLQEDDIKECDKILRLAIDTLDSRYVYSWFCTAKKAYKGVRPLDLLRTQVGRELVWANLNRIAEGGPPAL